MADHLQTIHTLLSQIYDTQTADSWASRFYSLIQERVFFLKTRTDSESCITEHSALLITYADSLKSPDVYPLTALFKFLTRYVGEAISTVHLLPFYPASSDDGFSVIDPLAVDPEVGTWEEISDLQKSYKLMFDLVANHLSRQNSWVKRYIQGDPEFADFAIEVTGNEDISQVFRPRSLPLFSTLESAEGIKKLVWTTFSDDQIDLNYRNPKVLLLILEVFLSYITHGATLIRLDAIAFIWKELGTSCIHLENTHRIIQFFRWILDTYIPGTGIITETNVPHKENISYFGNGCNEASLVYNFPLPPLVLHTFLTGNSEKLSSWAAQLEFPSEKVTYFNFLASHDGIGVVPAKGILSPEEITQMADHVKTQGGFVSYKSESDGSKSPYELNCSYLSAVSNLEAKDSNEIITKRFIASQAIMLSLRGIPGIYIHSLLGSQNWLSSPDLTTHPRRINREKLNLYELHKELADKEAIRSRVLTSYVKLLNIHRQEAAFSPIAAQRIWSGNPALFVVLRETKETVNTILCVINVTGTHQSITLSNVLGALQTAPAIFEDLLDSGRKLLNAPERAELDPYQVCWFKKTEITS